MIRFITLVLAIMAIYIGGCGSANYSELPQTLDFALPVALPQDKPIFFMDFVNLGGKIYINKIIYMGKERVLIAEHKTVPHRERLYLQIPMGKFYISWDYVCLNDEMIYGSEVILIDTDTKYVIFSPPRSDSSLDCRGRPSVTARNY